MLTEQAVRHFLSDLGLLLISSAGWILLMSLSFEAFYMLWRNRR